MKMGTTARSRFFSFPVLLCLLILFQCALAIVQTNPELKRCPQPRSLCNRAESFDTEFLDETLENYFSDEFDTAVEGDRELIWWALAGGEEGKWWWDRSANGGANHYRRMVKRQAQLNETQEEKEDRMAKDRAEWEARQEEERRQREQEEKVEDATTNWPDNQRGFCCDEGFKCLALSVDKSIVYCWDDRFVLKQPA